MSRLREDLWRSLLDAELNARYTGLIARRYLTREKWTKVFLAVTSSTTVAAWGLWQEEGELAWKLLSGLSAVIAVALPVLKWPRIVELSSGLAGKWRQLQSQYERLWRELSDGRMSLDEVAAEYEKARETEIDIDENSHEIPEDGRLLREVQQAVLRSRGLDRGRGGPE